MAQLHANSAEEKYNNWKMDELTEMRQYLEQQRRKINEEKVRLDQILSPRDHSASTTASVVVLNNNFESPTRDKENVEHSDVINPFRWYDKNMRQATEDDGKREHRRDSNEPAAKDDNRRRPESWQIKEYQKNLNETMEEPYNKKVKTAFKFRFWN